MNARCAALILLLTPIHSSFAFRYDDALYLDDIKDSLPAEYSPLILKVEKVTGIYSDKGLQSRLMNALPGEEVQVLAITPDSYQVSSTKKRFVGWTDPATLTALKPETLQTFKALVEEEKAFQSAIKNKQVIAGMRPKHVLDALGKPNKVSNRTDETGSFEIWSYIITEPIYQDVSTPVLVRGPNGSVYTQNVIQRQKVGEREVSSTSIEFKNNRVTAIENKSTSDRVIDPSITKKMTSPDGKR